MFGLGTIINIVVNVIPAVVNVVSAIVAQGNNFIANAVNTVAGWFGGGSGSSGSGGSNSSRSSGGSSSNRGPSSVSNFEEQRRIAVQQRQQRQSLERDISYSLEQSEPEEEPPLNFADLLLPALVPAEIMLAAWGNPVAESMVIMLRNERGLFEAMMNAAASPEEGLRNLFAEAGRNDEWDRQALDLFNRFKSDMQIVGTKTNQLHGGGGDDLIDPTSPSSEDVQAHIYDTGVGSDDILPTAEELRRIVAINTTLEQLDILTSLPSNHILYMSPDPAQRGVGDFRILSDIVAHNTSNNLEDYLYVMNTILLGYSTSGDMGVVATVGISPMIHRELPNDLPAGRGVFPIGSYSLHPDFYDDTNQIGHHIWAYVATGANPNMTVEQNDQLGTVANIFHDIVQPVGRNIAVNTLGLDMGPVSSSWADVLAGEVGLTLGQQLRTGEITPEQFGAIFEDTFTHSYLDFATDIPISGDVLLATGLEEIIPLSELGTQ